LPWATDKLILLQHRHRRQPTSRSEALTPPPLLRRLLPLLRKLPPAPRMALLLLLLLPLSKLLLPPSRHAASRSESRDLLRSSPMGSCWKLSCSCILGSSAACSHLCASTCRGCRGCLGLWGLWGGASVCAVCCVLLAPGTAAACMRRASSQPASSSLHSPPLLPTASGPGPCTAAA
jgi:hypothetical protein